MSGSHISGVQEIGRDVQCIKALCSQEYLQNNDYNLPQTTWKRRCFILLHSPREDSTIGYFRESLYILSQTSFSSVDENIFTSQSIFIVGLPSCLSIVAINVLNRILYKLTFINKNRILLLPAVIKKHFFKNIKPPNSYLLLPTAT